MFYFTKRAITQREAVLDQYAIRIYTYTVHILVFETPLFAFVPHTVSIYCCSGGQMMQGNMRGKVQMGVKNQECDDGKI